MPATVDRSEASAYYFTYIDQVGEGDICRILEAQFPETHSFLRSISDAKSLHRYAPDKWTIREVVSHLNDTERLIARLKMAEIPRNGNPTRVRNRCELTGRSRGFYRKFRLSRVMLRELGNKGLIPGLTKSSW